MYDDRVKNIRLRGSDMSQNSSLIDRITIDSRICHGKPCIRGLRYPVQMILELLSGDMTPQAILADYPDLEPEDIQACLAYAARLSQVKSIGRAAQ